MKFPPGRASIGVTVITFLILASRASALAPGDEHWDYQFGVVGASSPLYAAAVANGNVYVGGLLIYAGNTKANFVAGFNGTNWVQLNDGVGGNVNLAWEIRRIFISAPIGRDGSR